MDYLPLFFDLRGKDCLVVGGGAIATRKARLLVKAGARVTVVAPDVETELAQLAVDSGGQVLRQTYDASLLVAPVLVVSATDVEVVNRQVSADCHARRLPVNVVDSPALCSVITPAIVDRSPLILAASSGGESPVLARIVRAQLEASFPAAYGRLAKFASRFRDAVKERFADGEMRRRFWESVLNGEVAEQVLAGNESQAQAVLESRLQQGACDSHGEVYLVGAGPGDPDLLTFKALRLMQQAEVVLYDRLVSEPILEMVRRDADRIYVGKRRSDHSMPQEQINQLLLRLAQEGKRVLRLKGGDPFIFGRGGEEIDLLAAHQIAFQVVPGITAASGCAAYAGIPLTHRDYSSSVRFITGHLKDGVVNFDWREFVADRQTLVFYMGLLGLEQICQKLIEFGKPEDTPVALVERGTLPTQVVHVGDLQTMPELVKQREIHAPTLLIIGDVVKLHTSLGWYKR